MSTSPSDSKSTEDEYSVITLQPGAMVDSGRAMYAVEMLIGEGGFGAVYRVRDTATDKIYALKMENKTKRRRDSKLKMEIAILKEVSNERAENSHFASIVDRGKKERFYFIVMQLVGESLANLKSQCHKRIFSIGTALSTSNQCLEAIEDLHKHGYIHRDIKPGNFAIGTEDKSRIVYILDFGISRRYLNDRGVIKAPRASISFKGTIKFASIACHRGIELGPKDDCESWFYLFLDLAAPSGLPWQSLSERDAVLRKKEQSRYRHERMFRGLRCAKDLERILRYIDSLHYEDRVDYHFIYKTIKAGAKVSHVNLSDPFDWEEKHEHEKHDHPSKKKSRR